MILCIGYYWLLLVIIGYYCTTMTPYILICMGEDLRIIVIRITVQIPSVLHKLLMLHPLQVHYIVLGNRYMSMVNPPATYNDDRVSVLL